MDHVQAHNQVVTGRHPAGRLAPRPGAATKGWAPYPAANAAAVGAMALGSARAAATNQLRDIIVSLSGGLRWGGSGHKPLHVARLPTVQPAGKKWTYRARMNLTGSEHVFVQYERSQEVSRPRPLQTGLSLVAAENRYADETTSAGENWRTYTEAAR